MFKRAYLSTNDSRGRQRGDSSFGEMYAHNPPLPQRVAPTASITILMGEKACSLHEAARICRGKYPVYCQLHKAGRADPNIDRIESESNLRFMYAVPATWDRNEYLVIRRA
jgi:hypothetical protein